MDGQTSFRALNGDFPGSRREAMPLTTTTQTLARSNISNNGSDQFEETVFNFQQKPDRRFSSS